MRAAGRELDAGDRPPALAWEAPVWALFELMRRQWRTGPGGLIGLDFGVAIALIGARGWSLWRALELLRVIEAVMLTAHEAHEAEAAEAAEAAGDESAA